MVGGGESELVIRVQVKEIIVRSNINQRFLRINFRLAVVPFSQSSLVLSDEVGYFFNVVVERLAFMPRLIGKRFPGTSIG